MSPRNIVRGATVSETMARHAKTLRRPLTPEEQILWSHLRRNNLGGYHFRRQQIIEGYVVDFYCHAAGLVVEVDGGIHRQQRAYDEHRDERLTAKGLRILRFTNEDVRERLPAVLVRVLQACKDAHRHE